MKYDINKTPTKGAERVLKSFLMTLFNLVAQKPFELITVNELCEMSGYPRATFYNYFDDKYDFLNYCWYSIDCYISLNDVENYSERKLLFNCFDRTYEIVDQNRNWIKKMLRYNMESGYLCESFKLYVSSAIRNSFEESVFKTTFDMPECIVTQHYANTLLLIMAYVVQSNGKCSKEEAHNYMEQLLNVKD